jgi:magnesium-transporting ATPase (P-type)
VIKVKENEFLPADVLLIASTGLEGLCYVETKSLDGETNLKHKVAPKQLNDYFISASNIKDLVLSEVFCEVPNKDLYKFDGKMQLPGCIGNDTIPLTNDNVLLRGMTLRNTEFIYGLILYTGSQTKIQMNSARSKYKTSRIMKTTNRQILAIFVVQIIFSSIAAFIGAEWTVQNLQIPYLDFRPTDHWESEFKYLYISLTGTWVLLFTNFVPISLLVTLELVKFWQATFMEYDLLMFDEKKGIGMQVNCSSINEELG